MHTKKRELFYFLIMIILVDSYVNKETSTKTTDIKPTITMNLRALLEWRKKCHNQFGGLKSRV
jgi:hypothetical protein